MPIYDLRKYNIKTMEEALEFLSLIRERIPQIESVFRKQRLKEAALKNRLNNVRPQETVTTEAPKSESIIERMNRPVAAPTETRLEQLKAASQPDKSAEISKAAKEFRATGKFEAPAPGEIGHLELPGEQERLESDLPDVTVEPPVEETTPVEEVAEEAPVETVEEPETTTKTESIGDVVAKAQKEKPLKKV